MFLKCGCVCFALLLDYALLLQPWIETSFLNLNHNPDVNVDLNPNPNLNPDPDLNLNPFQSNPKSNFNPHPDLNPIQNPDLDPDPESNLNPKIEIIQCAFMFEYRSCILCIF